MRGARRRQDGVLAAARHSSVRRSFEIDPSAEEDELALDVPDLVSAAAVYAADQLGVSRIVAFSQSGFTPARGAIPAGGTDRRLHPREGGAAAPARLGVRPLVTGADVGTLDDVSRRWSAICSRLAWSLRRPGGHPDGHPIRDRR